MGSNVENLTDRKKTEEMNTIRPQQTGEPAGYRRSLDVKRNDHRHQNAFIAGGDVGVVGGSMSGKGDDVNAGDLPGQDAARHPAEVRAAIVAQASHGKTNAGKRSGTMERSWVMTGGAKGGRKVERPRP